MLVKHDEQSSRLPAIRRIARLLSRLFCRRSPTVIVRGDLNNSVIIQGDVRRHDVEG